MARDIKFQKVGTKLNTAGNPPPIAGIVGWISVH